MVQANLKSAEDLQTIRDQARAALEAPTNKVDERVGSELVPVSKVRHLDVDAVLARSLAKVVSE